MLERDRLGNASVVSATAKRELSVYETHAYTSGDQLSTQNSLKINIKFLESLLEINFYSLTIIFLL